MPLYEYECPDCGARREVLQKLGADGKSLVCQQCSRVGLHRILSSCVSSLTKSSSACASGSLSSGGFA